MRMVNVGPNPNYKLPVKDPKATAEAAAEWETLNAAWSTVKGERPKLLPYVTAMDNIRNSGGMYSILAEKAEASTASAIQMPEEMSLDALKLTALQLGVDLSRKGLKRADLIKAVRLAMDNVQLAADDEDEAE